MKITVRVKILLLCTFGFTWNAFSQCIDRKKIDGDGDRLFWNYCYLVPSYSFAYGGDTSKNWNYLYDNIDIRQAPKNALKFKSIVEREIRSYAGREFFKCLKFDNVEVVYPNRMKLFKDNGAMVSFEHYKCKYFYNYRFELDTVTAYLIGVAVNSKGKIISPFVFPSKRHYKPINKNFTYCSLIEIAKKIEKNIEPIGKIEFYYDKHKGKFYWIVTQEVVDQHEGINYINQVIIDAANFKNAKSVKSSVIIEY